MPVPNVVFQSVIDAIDGEFPPKDYRHDYYAGEFFEADVAAKINPQSRSDRGVFFYDIESITNITGRQSSDKKSSATDEYIVAIYCCRHDVYAQTVQWRESLEYAYRLRETLEGVRIDSVANQNAEAVWIFDDITREFHSPKLSCHTLRMRIEVPSQIDPDLP